MCYIAFVSALQLQPKGQPIQTMWEALEELMRHCNTTSKVTNVPSARLESSFRPDPVIAL